MGRRGQVGQGSADDAAKNDIDALDVGVGRLEVRARTELVSYLGALHLVVTNAAGDVVGGVDEETTEPSAHGSLLLEVPAARGYALHLTTSADDAQTTSCRAEIDPVDVEAGATARVQVYAWDCGERVGYVPEREAQSCYWLADWAFVGNTEALVGDEIAVAVVAPDGARFHWSSASARLSSFADEAAASTVVSCAAAGDDLEFQVVVEGPDCQQLITQRVSCLGKAH